MSGILCIRWILYYNQVGCSNSTLINFV
uniref:Uncharacterized protein n=1 Tax=Arundo donax TaxID=35708 RepID=A0A0A9HMY4_ARUDO